MRLNKSFVVAMMAIFTTQATAQRFQQPLGRGVVCVNRTGGRSVTASGGQGSLISWRKLAEEPEGTTYNVYKRTAGSSTYTKVNASPLKATCLSTTLTANTEYAVTAISPDGVEGPTSAPFLYKTQPWPNVWLNIDYDNTVLQRNDYRTKFVWPMDLDGDGEYDAVVVDRLFAGAANIDDAENQTDNTATTTHKIQAYRFSGELLWTVDMGPNVNICSGQNDMVLAYDINCDGRCEVLIRSSDGTRFWNQTGKTWGKYVGGSDSPDVDGDGIVDYRTQDRRNPPFYISVIDGLTGAELNHAELNYSQLTDGSDTYSRNNRSFYRNFGYGAMEGHYGIAYLDGLHPSLVMECADRESGGLHHVYVLAWDFDWTSDGKPANWHHSATWSANDKRPSCAEFHQIRILDSDGDGCDELWTGGYGVNPVQQRFTATGLGHGDRFIISDIDPERPGIEGFSIQQSALLGQCLFDAGTAERIKEWYLPSVYDVARGTCLDMDARYKGYEILSYADEFVYTCKGEKTGQTRTGTMFEGCWWDGDLLREWLNSPGGSGWGTNMMVTKVLGDRLAEFSQESNWVSHGATGTRPAFVGDIIGDWREEVLLAKQDDNICSGLVGYTTNIPTQYSIYCLQQDPHYRGDCTTRGYYQHPNTGFYLGGAMPMPPLPPVFVSDLRWKGSGQWTTYDMTRQADYADGQRLMFDIAGDNSQPVSLSTPLNPQVLYIMNPRGHDYTFQGNTTTGSGQLIKSMLGTATVNGHLGHTGQTIISEGTLCVNGTISGPVELRAKGTLSGKVTLTDTITFEGALNYEGCRLAPGNANDHEGIITLKKSTTLPGEVYLEVTAGGKDQLSCGRLSVEGDLTLKGTNYITINLTSQEAATYVLAECTGTLTADPALLQTRGLEGINYDIVNDGSRLLLIINATRSPQQNVVWTGEESNVWNYKSQNFSIGQPTAFVAGDAVVFNGQGSQNNNITVDEMMVTSGVSFDSGTYTLSGEGGISGEGGVTVNPAASVTLNMKYSDYTGPTIVNGGTLTVPNFYDGLQKSAIGASPAAQGNLQLNGGTLVLSRDNMGTDRRIVLTDTATIRIAQSNSALSLKGIVSGTGYLVKDGPGQLNFTYGGTNNFAGLIVKRGIVAQGAWNSTFGRSGSPMVLAGGEVHQIDVNSTSTVPTLNHSVTVVEGTSSKIVGSSRGKINGSFHGKGALTIQTRYVRCDVGADFSDFEGTLTAIGSGGNFRLMSNVTNMNKTRLVVGAGTTLGHFASGGAGEQTVTTRIGALSGTATDGVLGGSGSTWQVGELNEDTQFSGLLKAQRVIKTGTGKLTLRTAGHTAPITVNAGTLELNNSGSTVMTSGLITVANGATLQGNGLAGSVTVSAGGTITGGTGVTVGTLRVNQTLTLQQDAIVLCRLTTASNTRITANGTVKHNGETILVSVPATRKLAAGDEIVVFNGSATHSGTFVLKVEAEGMVYEFDDSTLLTDGKLRVKSAASGIQSITAGSAAGDAYDLLGRKQSSQPRKKEMYIRNGRKYVER